MMNSLQCAACPVLCPISANHTYRCARYYYAGMNRFKPSVTVAAIIEHEGRFLLVEEHTPEGARLNQPAGHLEQGESPEQACVREVREETARVFTSQAFLGVYLGRFQRDTGNRILPYVDINNSYQEDTIQDITYVRLAFCSSVTDEIAGAKYDKEIIRTLWLTPEEIREHIDVHRSPLVLQCIDDYLAHKALPLERVFTHASVYGF
jgi:8-oxo-dGTP pyrophosphatase MutT (NUDIX family)